MTREVLSLEPHTDIFAAVEFLLYHGVSGAPVTERGKLMGIISEKDCLTLLATGVDMLPHATVGSFMTRDVTTLSPDLDIVIAASRFLSEPYRRYPVVEDGLLVGLISRRDILRAIHELRQRQRRRERPGG